MPDITEEPLQQSQQKKPAMEETSGFFVPGFASRFTGTLVLLVPVLLSLVILVIVVTNRGPVRPGTIMFVTGLLTVVLVFFTFIVLMNRISPAFRTLDSRGILVAGTGLGVQKFVADTFSLMDDRLQWVIAELFMVLPITWFMAVDPGPLLGDPLRLSELFIEMLIAFLIGLIAWRLIATGVQIKKIPSHFSVKMQPGHPDQCGGLAPLGNLCLLNALIIALPGIYLGGWIAIGPAIGFEAIAQVYRSVFTILLLVPVIFSGFTFFIPLWETHRVMVVKKEEILHNLDELAESLNRRNLELLTIPENVEPDRGLAMVADLEKVLAQVTSLETIYARYQKLSEWPFNTGIFLQFLTTQAVPVLTLAGISQPVAGFIVSLLGLLFPGAA